MLYCQFMLHLKGLSCHKYTPDACLPSYVASFIRQAEGATILKNMYGELF